MTAEGLVALVLEPGATVRRIPVMGRKLATVEGPAAPAPERGARVHLIRAMGRKPVTAEGLVALALEPGARLRQIPVVGRKHAIVEDVGAPMLTTMEHPTIRQTTTSSPVADHIATMRRIRKSAVGGSPVIAATQEEDLKPALVATIVLVCPRFPDF